MCLKTILRDKKFKLKLLQQKHHANIPLYMSLSCKREWQVTGIDGQTLEIKVERFSLEHLF